jgi:predicted Fe-Mo cluster-binding NifX family protein
METIMKIVVTASGMNLDSNVDPRFGRAACLLIIDSETGALLEAIDNSQGVSAAQGAGIGAAAMVADRGVQAVLTGQVGPKAMAVIEKSGIQVVAGVSGSVREAVDTFRAGSSPQACSSTGNSGGGTGKATGGGGKGHKCGCGCGQGGGAGKGSGQGKGQNRKQ